MLQGKGSAMIWRKHGFGVRKASDQILAQEGHAAMQVGPVPPFALVSFGIHIFIKTIFCSEEWAKVLAPRFLSCVSSCISCVCLGLLQGRNGSALSLEPSTERTLPSVC